MLGRRLERIGCSHRRGRVLLCLQSQAVKYVGGPTRLFVRVILIVPEKEGCQQPRSHQKYSASCTTKLAPSQSQC